VRHVKEMSSRRVAVVMAGTILVVSAASVTVADPADLAEAPDMGTLLSRRKPIPRSRKGIIIDFPSQRPAALMRLLML
jgi:hypothetical protein